MLDLAERDRRYDALRAAARERGWNALLVVGHGDCVTRGRIAYVSNFHLLERVMFFVLPLDADPVIVTEPLVIFAGTDWVHENRLSWEPGAETGRVLSDLGIGNGSVGIVGMKDALSVGNHRDLMAVVPNLTLADADEVFEDVIAIKSPAEVEELRGASADLRVAADDLASALKPGVTERELLAVAHESLRARGALDTVLAISRPPFATESGPTGFHYPTTERISSEDVVVVSFDVANEAGYWCELRRVYSFDEPSEEQAQFWDFRVEAFRNSVNVMSPGVSSARIGDALDEVCKEYGYSRENILSPSAHGIGVEIHENPVTPGWDVELKESMVVCLHPFVNLKPKHGARVADISIADSVLITDHGGERLTDLEDRWIVVD